MPLTVTRITHVNTTFLAAEQEVVCLLDGSITSLVSQQRLLKSRTLCRPLKP